jgi:hypothetical protein
VPIEHAGCDVGDRNLSHDPDTAASNDAARVIGRKASGPGNNFVLLDRVRVLEYSEEYASAAGRLNELLAISRDGKASPAEERSGGSVRSANSE